MVYENLNENHLSMQKSYYKIDKSVQPAFTDVQNLAKKQEKSYIYTSPPRLSDKVKAAAAEAMAQWDAARRNITSWTTGACHVWQILYWPCWFWKNGEEKKEMMDIRGMLTPCQMGPSESSSQFYNKTFDVCVYTYRFKSNRIPHGLFLGHLE